MNTPDQAPKDGDFVAYIEELERRQLRSSAPRQPGVPVVTPGKDALGAAAAASSPAELASKAGAVKGFPVGLLAIGLVLLFAGLAIDGGIFLIVLGIILLWQAARTLIRNARGALESNKSVAAQQVASLLASHAQRKKARTR